MLHVNLSALLAVLALTQVAATGEEPSRPNVLVVLADDLGWGDLACYGNPEVETPHLDALARAGTIFTSFYAASPSCSPSRAAFLTGRFPAELGIVKAFTKSDPDRPGEVRELPPEIPNVATILRQAGYRTAHLGKWHLGTGRSEQAHPAQAGFETAKLVSELDSKTSNAGRRLPSSVALVDAALEFLALEDARPFYLQVWLVDPHAPLPADSRSLERYERYRLPNGAGYGAPAIYMAAVTEMDAQLGRLFEGLKELGLEDETLVLFASDNGPEVDRVPAASNCAGGSSGPFRGAKRSLYEGGLRVPLIARWPGEVPAGRVADSMIGAVDLLPTVAALAGASDRVPAAVDGENLSELLSGADRGRTGSHPFLYLHPQPGRALDQSPALGLRRQNWMFLCDPGGRNAELYDLAGDPAQTSECSSVYADLAEELSNELLGWYRSLRLPDRPRGPVQGEWTWPH